MVIKDPGSTPVAYRSSSILDSLLTTTNAQQVMCTKLSKSHTWFQQHPVPIFYNIPLTYRLCLSILSYQELLRLEGSDKIIMFFSYYTFSFCECQISNHLCMFFNHFKILNVKNCKINFEVNTWNNLSEIKLKF